MNPIGKNAREHRCHNCQLTELDQENIKVKTKLFGTIIGAIALVAAVSATCAQSYSIDWFTIDGGGTSTGGVYSVTGTIGQHDAGMTMTNGAYSLTGGFWSLLEAVQTPGAPLLKITLTTTNTAVVSWPSPSSGFTLQQATDLTLSNWANAAPPSDNGSTKYLILNLPSGQLFFRLARP